jgi:hypothetical protein
MRRPDLLVDHHSFRLADPDGNILGPDDSVRFGRCRMLYALPLGEAQTAPAPLQPPALVVDQHGFRLADPAGNLLGKPDVLVSRLLSARWTEDTRRL